MNRGLLKALAFVVVTFAPVAVALPQGLADAAKKEQARRKKATPAAKAKVYTEADLPSSPNAGAPNDAEADAEKAALKASADADAARPGKKNPAELAAKMAAARAESYKAQVAMLNARIAQKEATVQQLAKHPTGGGKVCRLPEGVFQPGVTAPEQVVCPYQMESRYDVAKRELDEIKARLTAVEAQARRAGVIR